LIAATQVTGLKGLTYLDKSKDPKNPAKGTEQREAVTFGQGLVDSVYLAAPEHVELEVGTGGDKYLWCIGMKQQHCSSRYTRLLQGNTLVSQCNMISNSAQSPELAIREVWCIVVLQLRLGLAGQVTSVLGDIRPLFLRMSSACWQSAMIIKAVSFAVCFVSGSWLAADCDCSLLSAQLSQELSTKQHSDSYTCRAAAAAAVSRCCHRH
jgi:hypothetical protein